MIRYRRINENGVLERTMQRYVTKRNSSSSMIEEKDTICELAASNIRYGPGSTKEVGQDIASLNAKKVILFTDAHISTLPCMSNVLSSLHNEHIEVDVYEGVRVEPNDISFRAAIDYMKRGGPYDAVIALGGGSVIDTAKTANLYTTHPPPSDDFYAYVNPPVGKGLPPPGELLPLIAIPTTSGTGSETTGIAIFDDTPSKSKTGIGHRRIKPMLGIVDPDNTRTLPANVAKYTGLDVLCHAMESYTALPFHRRPKPPSPLLRPAYQGSNPLSDIWSLHAMQYVIQNLESFLQNPDNYEARSNVFLASTMAGIGFGNAGVHLCHGMSYPVASQVKGYIPEGYPLVSHALVPHGLSVILNAPSVFRFTGSADPERHFTCANVLASARNKTLPRNTADAGYFLAEEIEELMLRLDVPLGLKTLGYTEGDIPDLVKGAVVQHRVTKICPRQPVGEEELDALFRDAMS